jgi:hypothetical protein
LSPWYRSLHWLSRPAHLAKPLSNLLRRPRLARARTLRGRSTRAGLQNPTPTSRVRPVLYLQTGAMFALAALRYAARTSKICRIIYEGRRLAASFWQAILSNAFLNAFWNAFSKSFTSSEAPTCCAIATKRLWRSASVSLGLASDLRVMREQARSSHKMPVGRQRDCPLQKHDARAENLAYPHCNKYRK